MMRLGGPELKLPDLKRLRDAKRLEGVKMPTFVSDLYWDLHDRRLLPLLALGVVALVAVPILLGGGSKSEPPAAPVAPVGPVEATSTLTVARAKPGLREPNKRLAGRQSTDPFKQKYTASSPGSGGGASAGGGGEGNVTTVTTTSPSTSASTGSGGGGSGSGGSAKSNPAPQSHGPSPEPAKPAPSESGAGSGTPGQIKLFTFAIDVSVARTETTKSGAAKMGDPKTMHRVLPDTALPGKKAPVVTYLGVDPKTGKKAMMLVSPEVDSIFGDAKCLSGTTSCQLLALEPGMPEIFVYGPGQARFKINVTKVEPVQSGTLSSH